MPEKQRICCLINRRTGEPAAHEKTRLMLLGSPPDMVHGLSLHRACAPAYQAARGRSRRRDGRIMIKTRFWDVCTRLKGAGGPGTYYTTFSVKRQEENPLISENPFAAGKTRFQNHFFFLNQIRQISKIAALTRMIKGYPKERPYSGISKFIPYHPAISVRGRKITVMTVKIFIRLF